MGNISLLASQKATVSHSRGPQHGSTKGINTPPFPLSVPDWWGLQDEVLDHRDLSLLLAIGSIKAHKVVEVDCSF